MNVIVVYIWVWLSLFSMSIWESLVEGRNAWDKGKSGKKIKIPGVCVLTMYHFFIFFVMFPMLVVGLPLIVHGWDIYLFLILGSAYFSGVVIEDFGWYVVNPNVKIRELYSPFSDYYPWLKIRGKKILPWFYITGIVIAVALFYLSTKLPK